MPTSPLCQGRLVIASAPPDGVGSDVGSLVGLAEGLGDWLGEDDGLEAGELSALGLELEVHAAESSSRAAATVSRRPPPVIFAMRSLGLDGDFRCA